MSCKCIKLTPQECKEFAMWFAANYQFYDSVWQGQLYENKTTKQVDLIDVIFDKWLNT
jgi:hypothetical protein